MLEKLVGVTTSAMQINKVTDYYGTFCDEQALLKPVLGAVKKDEKLYVEVDESMVFTRELRLESQMQRVIQNVKTLHQNKKTESGKKLILYYEDNKMRMDYKYYLIRIICR